MAFPLINPYQQFFDSSGSPLVSGTIEFRNPTTNALINSYPTADDADAQTNANANPLTLSASGNAPSGLYLEDGVKYKVILKDSTGATVTTQDDVRSPIYSRASIGTVFYPQTSAEAAAGVTPTNYHYDELDARRYGYVADDSTDNSTALSSANSVATQHGGGTIRLPAGTGRIASDFSLGEYNTLAGEGEATILHCVAASVKIDASTAAQVIDRCTIRDLSIKRTSTAGPCIDLISNNVAAAGDVVARCAIDRVRVLESTGDGIRVKGVVGLDIYHPYIESCTGYGLYLSSDDGTTQCNAVNVFGGEIRACAKGVYMVLCSMVCFWGTVIENCSTSGVDIYNNNKNIQFRGCWFETNAGYEIRYGAAGAAGSESNGLIIDGCHFDDGVKAKEHAIELVYGRQIRIDNCYVNGYGTEFVKNNPYGTGTTEGHIGEHIKLVGSTPSNCTGEDVWFYTNAENRGDDTATLNGWSDISSDVIYYSINGTRCTLFIPQLSGTSNATTKSLSGLSTAARPTTAQTFPIRVSDNGTAAWGRAEVKTDGTVDFYRAFDGSAWTSTGNNLIYATAVTYDLKGA